MQLFRYTAGRYILFPSVDRRDFTGARAILVCWGRFFALVRALHRASPDGMKPTVFILCSFFVMVLVTRRAKSNDRNTPLISIF